MKTPHLRVSWAGGGRAWTRCCSVTRVLAGCWQLAIQHEPGAKMGPAYAALLEPERLSSPPYLLPGGQAACPRAPP